MTCTIYILAPKSISYHYDMDGVRDSKTVDGVKHEYITQGGNVTLERWNDGEEKSLEFVYDNGGAPYSVIYSHDNEKDTYYYILNQQGDVIRIVDTSGKTVSEYTYNGWGEILNVSNAKNSEIGTLNPIRYRGYYYDSELNVYYLQSRYYDPVMKRMIASDDESLTADATLNNNNLFAYCDNNPVMRADTEGDIWNIVAGALMGAAYNGVTTVVGNLLAGEEWNSGLVNSVLSGAATGALGGAIGGVFSSRTEAVINAAVAGVVEAYNQVQTAKDLKGAAWKEDIPIIATNVVLVSTGTALSTYAEGTHGTSVKTESRGNPGRNSKPKPKNGKKREVGKSVKKAVNVVRKAASRTISKAKGAWNAIKQSAKNAKKAGFKKTMKAQFSSKSFWYATLIDHKRWIFNSFFMRYRKRRAKR